MGIWGWGYISSTAESIKQNAPDLTPVKGFCRSSYDYTRAAVTRIYNIVTPVTVNTVEKLRDQETQKKIVTNLAKYSAREGLRCVPGGLTVFDGVSQSFNNKNNSKEYKEELQKLKDTISRLEKEKRDLTEQLAAIHNPLSKEVKSRL